MTMKEQRSNLTNVQDRFVDEYLKDPSDGGEAYRRASPKVANKKTASVSASKLLSMPKIQEELKARAKNYLGVLEARIMQNVEFWLNIRDGNIEGSGKGALISKRDVLDILLEFGMSDKSEGYKMVNKLESFMVNTVRVTDRMKASENLGKYMQMFVEKKEVSIDGQVKIIDDI